MAEGALAELYYLGLVLRITDEIKTSIGLIDFTHHFQRNQMVIVHKLVYSIQWLVGPIEIPELLVIVESDEIWDGINTKVNGGIPDVSDFASTEDQVLVYISFGDSCEGQFDFLAQRAALSPEIYDGTRGFVEDFLELGKADDVADHQLGLNRCWCGVHP